jgi:hypothetical protein
MKRPHDVPRIIGVLVGVFATATMPAGCGGNSTGGPKGVGSAGAGGVTGISGTGGATRGTGGEVGTGGARTGAGGATTGFGGIGDQGGAGGGGGRTASGTGGGIEGGAGGTDGGSLGGDGSVGPSCKLVGPCTTTEVVTYNGSIRMTSYVYDANQRLLRKESAFDANGVPKLIVTYSYDEHGWLLESRSNDCDDPAFGCSWFIYTYDSAGRVLTKDDHSDYSGQKPGCTTNTYDQSGRLVREEFAWLCGDTPDHASVYEYDTTGRLLSRRYEYDGKPRTITTFSYDDAGFLAFAYTSSYGDGGCNDEETIAYTRDAAGNPLVEDHQRPGPNADDYTVFCTFDAMGNQLSELVRYSEGIDAGTDLWCWNRTFDPCGNPLTYEFWSGRCDVAPFSRTTLSYGCFATASE